MQVDPETSTTGKVVLVVVEALELHGVVVDTVTRVERDIAGFVERLLSSIVLWLGKEIYPLQRRGPFISFIESHLTFGKREEGSKRTERARFGKTRRAQLSQLS